MSLMQKIVVVTQVGRCFVMSLTFCCVAKSDHSDLEYLLTQVNRERGSR